MGTGINNVKKFWIKIRKGSCYIYVHIYALLYKQNMEVFRSKWTPAFKQEYTRAKDHFFSLFINHTQGLDDTIHYNNCRSVSQCIQNDCLQNHNIFVWISIRVNFKLQHYLQFKTTICVWFSGCAFCRLVANIHFVS